MRKKSIFKESMLVLAIILSLNLFMAGTGLAKEEENKKEANHDNNQSQKSDSVTENSYKSDKNEKSDKSDKKTEKSDKNEKSDKKTEKPDKSEKSDKSDKDDNSVNSDVYKSHPSKHEREVPRGLLIAYLKTQGTSAQAVIGDLLLNKYSVTEIVYSFKNSLGKGKLTVTGNVYGGINSVTGGVYGTITVVGSSSDNSVTGAVYSLSTEWVLNLVKELRDELKTSSHTAVDKADALEQLSELYDNIGQNENAIEVQKDAIKTNPFNLDSYKKLGLLLKTKGDKDIKGFVNGEQVIFDVLPVIQSQRTLVPFRAISESLKAGVKWNEAEKSVTVSKNGVEVKLIIGSKIALVNGKEVTLDTPAQLIKGRTFIPVRFISESFKAEVHWEPDTQSVIVNETK